jgi:hypothetical protein
MSQSDKVIKSAIKKVLKERVFELSSNREIFRKAEEIVNVKRELNRREMDLVVAISDLLFRD